MTARIGRARHNRISSRGDDVLLGRTTFYGVIASEGGIAIASFGSDRSGSNARRHAPSESEMHCELRSVAVDRNCSHAAAGIAGQGQITYVD